MLARRITKHLPKVFKKYRIYRERNQYYTRNINIPRCDNVEFVCALGGNLPLKNNSIDAVCSSNVIDIVKEPKCLLREKIRILRKNGLFLMSDPYDFHPLQLKAFSRLARKAAREMIRKVIQKEISIVEEKDNIPWISRHYNRNYMIYFNHCLAGIKKEE
jgi:SAM-dependent methyltransferase